MKIKCYKCDGPPQNGIKCFHYQCDAVVCVNCVQEYGVKMEVKTVDTQDQLLFTDIEYVCSRKCQDNMIQNYTSILKQRGGSTSSKAKERDNTIIKNLVNGLYTQRALNSDIESDRENYLYEDYFFEEEEDDREFIDINGYVSS